MGRKPTTAATAGGKTRGQARGRTDGGTKGGPRGVLGEDGFGNQEARNNLHVAGRHWCEHPIPGSRSLLNAHSNPIYKTSQSFNKTQIGSVYFGTF